MAEDRFVFLRIFTVAREPLPSFITFLAFLIPIVAIALAFDSVNGEFNRRTISRILAQPIYRDALLFGKFLAGLATLGVFLTALWLFLMASASFSERRADPARARLPAAGYALICWRWKSTYPIVKSRTAAAISPVSCGQIS